MVEHTTAFLKAMSIREWVQTRTGLVDTVKDFFYEEIPASSGWPQVFGSVALFVLLVQACTGVLLAFNFAASPAEAYDSVSYIVRDVTGGRIMRGLHHWGASMMIVVVAAHAAQVFLYGAYRKPREATWLCGVALLLVVLGFGLTGYLLPWDNRAYWGTVVSTQIAGQAPVLGAFMHRLLGATNGIGVVTFTRFYALHVLVLPAATIGLTFIHLLLVRRHGVQPSSLENPATVHFYPTQAMKDIIATFVAFAGLLLAAILLDAPLGRVADPADTTYVPRPDWYFLFLFQTLKFFHGALEPLAGIGLPTAAVIILVLLPFLDRSQAASPTQRRWAIAVCVSVFSGWASLTWAALAASPHTETIVRAQPGTERVLSRPATELAGFAYFRDLNCAACHDLAEGEPKRGPTLALINERRPAEWVEAHIRSINPQAKLAPSELGALVQFVLRIDPTGASELERAPADLLAGADIFTRNLCQSCHRINGVGGQAGPSLNGLVNRRSRSWVERHFAQPHVLSPGSLMPAYHFNPGERKQLIDYLFELP